MANSVGVIALCNSLWCIGSAYMGNSACSTAFTENPDTLFTQDRHIGHLHKEV